MSYQVIWTTKAERELTDMWLRGEDRRSVSAAARAVDRQLRLSPLDVGESRHADARVFLAHPLGVTYRVSQEQRLVLVINVWRFRKRGSKT